MGNCLDGRCQPGWIYVFKVILRGKKLSSVPLPLKFFSSVANQNRLIKLLDAFSIEHLITLLNIYDTVVVFPQSTVKQEFTLIASGKSIGWLYPFHASVPSCIVTKGCTVRITGCIPVF